MVVQPVTRNYRLRIALIAFAAVIAIGTAGLVLLEGWSWGDALWMIFITLSTIGYGEVHPLSPAGRYLMIGLFVCGLSLGGYVLTEIARLVVEGEMAKGFLSHYRRRRLEQLNNHFIIVGYGRLGEAIAKELRDERAQYCVIESDREHAEELRERLKVPLIIGDAASEDVLCEAGIERARGIAIALPSAPEAVYITLSARQLAPDIHILTRVDDPSAQAKARRAGANTVVSPAHMGGWRMAQGLVRPHASHVLDMATLAADDRIRFDEVLVPLTSPLLGEPIRRLPAGSSRGLLIVAIRRKSGKMVTTPDADVKIQGEDVLIAIGVPAAVKLFRSALEGKGGKNRKNGKNDRYDRLKHGNNKKP